MNEAATEAGGPETSGRLRADLVLEYPFTRTTGEVVGTFLTGLREGVIYGVRRSDGSVLTPPVEYDPDTAEPLREFCEVGPEGEVVSWTWCAEARPMQPWDHPFAWALIRLDGADTAMLHAVCPAGPASTNEPAGSDSMRTGMRVKAVWREEREGHIRDIKCFVPA